MTNSADPYQLPSADLDLLYFAKAEHKRVQQDHG